MAEASTSVAIPALGVARGGPVSRFTRWLASERVFRLIPFVLVETLFVLIVLVPFALTIWISLLKWRANRPFETARFSGLENYESVLGNDQFWLALGRTFYFAGVAVALELFLGFVLAMLVSRCTRSRKLYTTIFLVPMMIVPIVVGYNFSMIYIDSGPLNQILSPFLERFGIDPRIRWLSHPIAAQWGIILADVWQWTPFMFVILLAGLAAIPDELYEATEMDGAQPRQSFFFVTLPLLTPIILIAVTFRFIDAAKLFDIIYSLTRGGPGTETYTTSYFLYYQGFQAFHIGQATAGSWMFMIALSVIAYWLVRRLLRPVEA